MFWEERGRVRKEAGILNAKLILHAIQGVPWLNFMSPKS